MSGCEIGKGFHNHGHQYGKGSLDLITIYLCLLCSRCVTNQRPLLESGTLGAKGHVQVIVSSIG